VDQIIEEYQMTISVIVGNSNTGGTHKLSVRVQNLVDGCWIDDLNTSVVTLESSKFMPYGVVHPNRRLVLEEIE
jgi:hypothetical protein